MPAPKRKKTGVVETQQTIELLETHDLLALFFEDLDHFKNTARATLATSPANIDLRSAVIVGKYPYMAEIKERLGFLEHVLSSTHFTLGIPQVTTFWNDLVLNALVPEERDEAFTWLERTRGFLSSKAPVPQAEDSVFHLFLELVPSLNVDQLSKEGFSFFDYFYRYVNFKLHKLTQAENKYVPSVFYYILSFLPILKAICGSVMGSCWHAYSLAYCP